MTSAMEELLEDVCPDLPVCSCAGCGEVMVPDGLSKKHRHFAAGLRVVFLRARGVPFCRGCTADEVVKQVLRTRFPHEADPCQTPTPTTAPTRTPCESQSP